MAKRPKQDEGMTTLAIGEEGPAEDGDEGMTTMMVGEEAPTKPDGEHPPAKPAPTKKKGEEAVTTLAVGEESGGASGGGKGNPFGSF